MTHVELLDVNLKEAPRILTEGSSLRSYRKKQSGVTLLDNEIPLTYAGRNKDQRIVKHPYPLVKMVKGKRALTKPVNLFLCGLCWVLTVVIAVTVIAVLVVQLNLKDSPPPGPDAPPEPTVKTNVITTTDSSINNITVSVSAETEVLTTMASTTSDVTTGMTKSNDVTTLISKTETTVEATSESYVTISTDVTADTDVNVISESDVTGSSSDVIATSRVISSTNDITNNFVTTEKEMTSAETDVSQTSDITSQKSDVTLQDGDVTIQDSDVTSQSSDITSPNEVTSISGPDHTTDFDPTCTDNEALCSYWAGLGECAKNPGYMNTECRRSCNKCGQDSTTAVSDPDCNDILPNCTQVFALCYTDPSNMNVVCKRTCNACKYCQNTNENCGFWANTGECLKNPAYMSIVCRKSCNACIEVSTEASVSPGNDVTVPNEVTTVNDVTENNDITTGSNTLTTESPLSTEASVSPGNDVTVPSEVTTGNDVTENNDITTGSNTLTTESLYYHTSDCTEGCFDLADSRLTNTPLGLSSLGFPALIFPHFFSHEVAAYCDCSDDGWTVIQRRMDGSVNFTRPWPDYVNGFGSVLGEYWLGLNAISNFTEFAPVELRIDMEYWDGSVQTLNYENFVVGRADIDYTVSSNFLSGPTSTDSLAGNEGSPFSTFDNDNRLASNGGQCPHEINGGWWHAECQLSNLNGKYYFDDSSPHPDGIIFDTYAKEYRALKKVEMKVRNLF